MMSVYVDTLIVYPNAWGPFLKGSCHLVADTLDELHEFADKTGMKRHWFQYHTRIPHYDLTPTKRSLAIQYGAIPISAMEAARQRKDARKKIQTDQSSQLTFHFKTEPTRAPKEKK